MTTGLLVIGEITDEMRAGLEGAGFGIHDAHRMDDAAAFLKGSGADIPYVLTDGHYGVRPEWLRELTGLRLVSNYGVGYDAIDIPTMLSRDIVVTHTPGVLSDEVATSALMLMIACRRNLRESEAHLRDGGWAAGARLPLSRTADHLRTAILGLGRIGLALARKLEPFNAEIGYHNRNARDVPYRYFKSLVEMAGWADVLFVVTPGGEATRGLVSGDVLDALGPQGLVVNVARGSVIDEPELVAALQNGRIGGAGLDVFVDEPHVPKALLGMGNVVLTPHIGSATIETRRAMGQLVVDNLIRHKSDGCVISPVPECLGMARLAPGD